MQHPQSFAQPPLVNISSVVDAATVAVESTATTPSGNEQYLSPLQHVVQHPVLFFAVFTITAMTLHMQEQAGMHGLTHTR